MADGQPKRVNGPHAPTADRIDLLLALLARTSPEPVRTERIATAMGCSVNALRVALDHCVPLDLIDTIEGDRRAPSWVLFGDGFERARKREGDITPRMVALAVGSVRVCPTCKKDHDEQTAPADQRVLHGRSDTCAECWAAVHGPVTGLEVPGKRDLTPVEARLLGFLVAHPGWWGVGKYRAAAEHLATRMQVTMRTRLCVDEAGKKVTDIAVKANYVGRGVALAVGLVCPGRESGECEECREAMAREGGKA